MKKPVRIMYIVIFAALILLPMLFLLAALAAEREERPDLCGKTAEEIPIALETFVGDNLPLRKELVYANGLFHLHVLRQSPSNDVIMGTDGWFFYKGRQDEVEDPLADYSGTNLFSEEQLKAIADNMVSSRDTAREAGADFIVVLAPNKERIYPEYMPGAYGPPAEICRLTQVYDYLRHHTDVNVVNLTETLSEYHRAYPEDRLYIRSDTHWSNQGAYIASKKTREALNLSPLPPLETLARETVNPPETDLAHLMGIDNYFRNDMEDGLIGYSPYALTRVTDGVTEQLWVSASGNAPYNKMFVTGDSFSVGMLRYLACDFNEVYMTFHYKYEHDMIASHAPDIIVYEVLERFLGYMERFRL